MRPFFTMSWRILTAMMAVMHSIVQPMNKEGGIILGTGGDESNGSQGNFYEGFMTKGAQNASFRAISTYKTPRPFYQARLGTNIGKTQK